jgi:hypothetical protein
MVRGGAGIGVGGSPQLEPQSLSQQSIHEESLRVSHHCFSLNLAAHEASDTICCSMQHVGLPVRVRQSEMVHFTPALLPAIRPLNVLQPSRRSLWNG